MNSEQERRRGKRCNPSHASQTLAGKQHEEHQGCWRGLALVFSMFSDTHCSPNPKLHHQYEPRSYPHTTKNNGANETAMDQQFQLGDPVLNAVRVHAKIGGWNIEPHDIELHEKIGQGTTADIYKGTWRGLDVAVKCLYPHFFETNEVSQTWFIQELETLSRQRHPFVLRLIGACLQPPQNGWIVTELLSGKTLTEWLYGNKERKRKEIRSASVPPLKERIEKGLEIAQGMQYLHEQEPKVIHRDLKPSNILLDDSMHVRVADFGHARFLTQGEQAFTGEMGTYVYMAPEVIRCEPYDEKCDVYSFGIILNELITGEHPYSETSYGPSQIALEVAEGRLRPKRAEEDPDHPYFKELIQLICCAWNADASARPTFAVITSTLRNILENELWS